MNPNRFATILSVAAMVLPFPLMAGSNLADLPDPLVGTDSSFALSHGNTYPGVFLPYAMANWTPQTGEGGWPYQFSKSSLIGFRMTHRPSAWMDDWGSFSLLPETGSLQVLPAARASSFSHAGETARAYEYSVRFANAIAASIVPTQHGGMLQFTFPASGSSFVILDAGDRGSSVQIDAAARTITGTNAHVQKGAAANFKVYFVAVFSKPLSEAGTWDDSGKTDREASRSGKHVGGYAKFATSNHEVVSVSVATSLISAQQAKRNLEAELSGRSFTQLVDQARAEWNRDLGVITVSGGTPEQTRTFYTALYHTFQFPRLLNETDAAGKTVHYSPYDGKVHDGPMFSDDGFWDTFRAAFPLLALLNPAKDAEVIRAMLNVYDEAGRIPKWPNPIEANVMIATHGDSVIADAYAKGIRDFDIQKAYAAVRKDGTEPGTGIFEGRVGIADYLKLGYVPADKVHESAARTLEDAYDDFCIAQLAHSLGKEDDYRMFLQHSQNYRNIYDRSSGFMRGRNSDGSWVEPFDPIAWGGPYTEGDAWQWLWSVQQDIPGLIQLLGGKEAFTKKLDGLFAATPDFKVGGYGQVIHEMTEAKLENMGQYAHINEPVHHVIYLYDYVGQPWKTQQLVHQVEDRLYKPGPAGWLGDEDTGQMSAWYIFGALGFYPETPGTPTYALGSPEFTQATLHLANGKLFTIKATRRNPADIYVQSVTLNGSPISKLWITHEQIEKGATLIFHLTDRPSATWDAVP